MEEILRLEEVAERYRTSPNTLRFWRHQGTGPHSFKLGRRVVYLASDVETWMQAQYEAGADRDERTPA